jgi:FMN phosphatase YigB (HAD superfamily)
MTDTKNETKTNATREATQDTANGAAPGTTPETAPAPDLERGTLFDMRSKEEIEEEKRRAKMNESQRKAEDSRKKADEQRKEAERKKKEEEERIYEAGTKLRYVGHLGRENIELSEPMNKKQVIAYLQDDYPEVTESRAKFRYDKEKKQIVVTMGSFDKG